MAWMRYQPQSLARPATQVTSLTGLWNFLALDARNLVSGRAVTFIGTTGSPTILTPKGMGLYSNIFAGSANAFNTATLEASTAELIPGTDATFVWFGCINSLTYGNVMCRGDDASGNGSSLRLKITTAGEAQFSYVDTTPTGITATTSGAAVAVGEFICLIGVKRGNTVSVYCKGKTASASGGNSGLRTSARGVSLGYTGNSSTTLNGSAAYNIMAATLSRAMSSAEAQATLANPWALFADAYDDDDLASALQSDSSGPFGTALQGSSLAGQMIAANAGAISSSMAIASFSASGAASDQPSGSFTYSMGGASMVAAGVIADIGQFASALDSINMASNGAASQNATGTFGSTLSGAAMTASGFHGAEAPRAPTTYRRRAPHRLVN